MKADLEKLSKKEFFCEEDAETKRNSFLSSHSQLMVEPELKVIETVTLKNARGRPSKNPKPPQEIRRWKIASVRIVRKEEKIEKEIEKVSSFCLLTNVDSRKQSSSETLRLYKGQGHVESLFSSLKQPMMAATIFLEKPERIQALMTHLYFGVLLLGVLRVISHIELEKEETPPRWGLERRKIIRPVPQTIIGMLAMFTVVSMDETVIIDANSLEMKEDLAKMLSIVRFDPDFV